MTNSSDLKVVWVTGAGFSIPLGGPSLADLFAKHRQARLEPALREITGSNEPELSGIFRTIIARYQQGQEKWWKDAEQFLVVCDEVTRDDLSSDKRQALTKALGISMDLNAAQLFANQVRLLLALECDDFLRGADATSELWLPYLRWAEHLATQDTVITLNYDRTPDILADETKNLWVPLPNEVIEEHDVARVLKLHGSTNWYVPPLVEGNGTATPPVERRPIEGLLQQEEQLLESATDRLAKRGHERLAMAAPGRQKINDSSTWFQPLWEAAEEAICNADVLVFVGYRFPETDNYVKSRLLGALRDNKTSDLRAHIVLGPDKSDLALQRLYGLLEWARPHLRVSSWIRVQPLWSQDFLELADRTNL